MSVNAPLEEKLRRALCGFYAGDAYGSAREAPHARNEGDILTWTENGDIVALLAACITQTAGIGWKGPTVAAISNWSTAGLPEIDKPASGLSTVAGKIIHDPRWCRDPAETAKRALPNAPPHIANINLPVATAIAFLCSPNAAVIEYAGMFAADPLTATVALFYVNAIRTAVSDSLPDTVDDMIRVAANDLPVLLPTESTIGYAYQRLADLDIGARPVYAMTTLRVICYALRITHWARKYGCRPDLPKILAHISSIPGSDASTNCAVAASIIHAGCTTSGFEAVWLDVDHRMWITERIDGLVNCWFRRV